LKGALDLGCEEAATLTTLAASARVGRRFGDYELLDLIGRGGMGVVYKAHQFSLNQDVALKMVLDGRQRSTRAIRRFQLEAEVAARLRHPNIVRIYHIGDEDGDAFFTMELISGESLSRRLARGEFRLPPAEMTKTALQQMQTRIARLIATTARAVHYAHEQGVLHRDIKPGNIILDAQGEPHLTDFGLAKISDASTKFSDSGSIAGTPAYMSPEQARGERLTPAADTYSLGVILYELLTGRTPFSAATPVETLRQITDVEPPNPAAVTKGRVDSDLATICLKCLEKPPVARYATARDLADDLERWLRHEPIRARPISGPEKLWRWCRRNPLGAAFVGTVCAALVTSLWLLYLVNREKNKQVALTGAVKAANVENNKLLKRSLGLLEENLEGIWGNREKRSIPVSSEEVAALAQLPIQPVSDKAALVRWSIGIIAAEAPAGQARRHAPWLDELQARTSQSLGRPVRLDLRIYKFHEDIVADLFAGKIDFARMGALRFLRVRRSQPGLQPLVVPITAHKVGVLFTRPDTRIRSIGDIRGRSVAFGDTNATISFWAQIKLAEVGIAATNLSGYDFLDSTLEFVDDVHELGFAEAVKHIGYLHSHAQAIEAVLSGRYEVGVTMIKAFQIHERRGLVAIPGTQFESSRTLWVARPGLDPAFAQAFIGAMTNLQGRWLEMLPEQSLGFRGLTKEDFADEAQWLDRIDALFPPKPSPPHVPVPDSDK
jgi:ABC-type phosphate/phosphonate transport system substrate-binding protein